MDDDYSDYAISDATYQWSVRAFTIVKRLLSVNIKLHCAPGQVDSGDVFLFNHFARFETFIPQYLIFRENGSYCRAVASSEFFSQDDAMANFLRSVGAVPNDHPRLLPFLASEIMRGRKVVVFPEGGMVKDRRVQDRRGGYSVYSRTARERRKQHRGAAVLGLALDAFKTLLQHAEREGNHAWIDNLAGQLRFDDVESLLAEVRRPTVIVPSNITFYPIRISGNLLQKGAELLNRGLSRRASEELLIESNILLRDTDMDIRFGDSIRVGKHWQWWERKLLQRAADRLPSLDDVFAIPEHLGGWDTRLLARRLRRRSERIRDLYMHEMYTRVTVNLSHLASTLIFMLIESGVSEIACQHFHSMLYLCIKRLQQHGGVHLHRSLRNPSAYEGLLQGDCDGLHQFLSTARTSQLLDFDETMYRFSDKLRVEHTFDEVRLENLVEVYANEVAPLRAVTHCTRKALKESSSLSPKVLAEHRLDDRHREYRWDKAQFSKSRYAEINQAQTAVEDGDWFLLRPAQGWNGVCVVLVHGFLASPREVLGFGERLRESGYMALGVRLRGHGTSPWDLRERGWLDWYTSLQQGYQIASGLSERVFVVGFSTGGALGLRLAADQPPALAGVCAVSVPIKFQDRNMMFVPLVHSANTLVRWVSSFEGVMPFRENDSEHPNINYRHIPIRGLHELRLLVGELEKNLAEVTCPLLVVQGDADPVVVPVSAQIVHDSVASSDKQLTIVSSIRHGILYEDIDNTQQRVLEFIEARRG